MKYTAEEILILHSENFRLAYVNSEHSERALVKADDALKAMREYARDAIKADRKNVCKHAKIRSVYHSAFGTHENSLDKDSIINAPNIELL